MMRSLNLEQVAVRIGKSYDWMQKHWRTIPGFPMPFVGAAPHQRPRWAEPAIDHFMMTAGLTQPVIPPVPPASPTSPANDPRPSRMQRLLKAAGG